LQADFEFGELFTQAARQAVPRARARGLGFGFDYRGPGLRWLADEAAPRQALCQVLDAAIDVLADGFVFFTAHVSGSRERGCHVAVAAASTGEFQPAAVWREVLRRLDIDGVQWMSDEALLEREAVATGVCPFTGGRLAFLYDVKEGSLFSLEVDLLPESARLLNEDVDAAAGGARAWIVNAGAAGTRTMERRLQRLGWATRAFDTVAAARRELECMASGYSRPSLVLAYGEPGVTAAALRPLVALLPEQTQVVLAVPPDTVLESPPGKEPGIETRHYPFSPTELRDFTRRAAQHADPSGETMPAPLAFEHRKRALVVDDNAVNQMVASGMLQVLGFEVDTASDGVEAIDSCMRLAPDLVLMDLHMPGMDGLEATRRLRLLQREGAIPLFPILAATADTTSQEACTAAGMDGHLPKPLNLAGLEHQLRRLLPL
jgi:CheY-like chemotaxis protein